MIAEERKKIKQGEGAGLSRLQLEQMIELSLMESVCVTPGVSAERDGEV